MRKYCLTLITAAAFCANVSAQEVAGYDDTKHEVAISTGAGTNTQIISAFTKMTEILLSATVTTVFTGGTLTGTSSYEDETEFVPLSAEYFYHFSPVVGFGGIFCYNGSSYDMYGNLKNNTSGSTEKTKIGKGSVSNITLMPAVKLNWLRTKYFGMYSKFGIGASLMLEKQKLDYEGKDETIHDDSSIIFNWQASLLGIEVGHPNVRLFAELGCGEQGILLGGLRCKF